MKKSFTSTYASKLVIFHVGVALLQLDTVLAQVIEGDTVEGNLTVTGSTTSAGWGLFQQGVDFGNNGEASLNWWPGTSPAGTVTFDINWADGTFTWRDEVTATTASNKMSLDAANALTLFRSNGAAGITFSPETGRITLPAGNGSTTGSGIYFGNSTTAAITASSTGIPVFSGNATFAGGIAITSNTPSSSSGSGALSVAGGIGAVWDSHFNGIRVGKGGGNWHANTAVGANTLSSNTTGNHNTAIGNWTQPLNTVGSFNTSTGSAALRRNVEGSSNSAFGFNAMHSNTNGSGNSAFGFWAMYANSTGHHNTAIGNDALSPNTTGSMNVAVGLSAGRTQANGTTNLTDAERSIYIGANSRGKDNNDDNSIVIGTTAIGLGANTTVIGNSATTRTHLHGQTTTASLEVSGITSLKGQVILDQPQGDISMGIYQ